MRDLSHLNFKPTPFTGDYTREELTELLGRPYKKPKLWFCFHDWVYWKFGVATRWHRVCDKCYKKQRDYQILAKFSSVWIPDKPIRKVN